MTPVSTRVLAVAAIGVAAAACGEDRPVWVYEPEQDGEGEAVVEFEDGESVLARQVRFTDSGAQGEVNAQLFQQAWSGLAHLSQTGEHAYESTLMPEQLQIEAVSANGREYYVDTPIFAGVITLKGDIGIEDDGTISYDTQNHWETAGSALLSLEDPYANAPNLAASALCWSATMFVCALNGYSAADIHSGNVFSSSSGYCGDFRCI